MRLLDSAGVASSADTLGQRIRSGPAQVHSVLTTLQKRIEEQRLLVALQVCCLCFLYCRGSSYACW